MSAAWGGERGTKRGASSAPPPSVPTLSRHRLDHIERDVSREFLIELVALFVTDVALRLERLSDAVKLRQTHKAAQFAHALQGAAASLGVLRLRSVAQRLEELVEQDDWGASERTLARLVSEFEHVRDVLGELGPEKTSKSDEPPGVESSRRVAAKSVPPRAAGTNSVPPRTVRKSLPPRAAATKSVPPRAAPATKGTAPHGATARRARSQRPPKR